jgi:hypothetical protein
MLHALTVPAIGGACVVPGRVTERYTYHSQKVGFVGSIPTVPTME